MRTGPGKNDSVVRRRRMFQDGVVEDVHSRLNVVYHQDIVRINSLDRLYSELKLAASQSIPVAVCGGRHAMGGQQFVMDGVLLDMRGLDSIIDLDRKKGQVKVQAGIQWHDLINGLALIQRDQDYQEIWSIIQKPTGADNLTIGGCLAANIHGRGLTMKPLVDDIIEFQMVTPSLDTVTVSRSENPELFKLVVGGYGLFGVVTTVTLKLRRRVPMRRYVEALSADRLIERMDELVADGHEYGDFQFAIDHKSDDFLSRGILATYKATDALKVPDGGSAQKLSIEQWKELLDLAHTDKTRAFEKYMDHYLKTDGQVYWSDTMQLSTYLDDYHRDMERQLKSTNATEIITELYVPRQKLSDFLTRARELFVKSDTDIIYGTIRMIEKDDQTFLPWAKDRFACVIFNLHTEHGSEALSATATTFRALIDIARDLGGSFYLTYHRYVERPALESCYPQFENFLALKKKHDPSQLFQSQWYRHYLRMFEAN